MSNFEAVIASRRTSRTAHLYAAAAERFASWFPKNGSFDDKFLLQKYADYLLKHLAVTSVDLHIAAVRSYLRWLEENGEDIAAQAPVQLPRRKRKVPRALSDDVIELFEAAAARLDEPYRTAILLNPYVGLRVRELCMLPLDSIRTDDDVLLIDVPGELEIGGKVHRIAKYAKPRTAPVLPPGVALLADYLDGWRAEQPESPWLFPSQAGGPMRIETLCRKLRVVRSELALTGLTPHMLRRTYVTMLERMGINDKARSEFVGHSSTSITDRFYSDRSQHAKDALGAIRAALRGDDNGGS